MPDTSPAAPRGWDGHPDDAFPPCRHMRGLLSALSDGTLGKGLRLRYARHHTAHCAHCAAALAGLIVLSARLRAYREARGEAGAE